MSEPDLLRGLLVLSMVVAPFATRRLFAAPSRLRAAAHGGALVCAAVGLFSPFPMLCVGWLVFCTASFALFLRSRGKSLRPQPPPSDVRMRPSPSSSCANIA